MTPLAAFMTTLALGSAFAVAAKSSGGGSGAAYGIRPVSCAADGKITSAQRKEYRAAVRDTAGKVEAKYGIKGLQRFLDTVAEHESRWNPCVDGDKGGVSKGIYQMRANTVFSTTYTKLRPYFTTMARDPVLSTLLAIHCVYKAARSVKGRAPYWLAVRRWWKYPASVNDHDNSSITYDSAGVRDRFAKALRDLNYPESFMNEQFSVKNYPGLPALMREFGYDKLADFAEKKANS